MSDLLFTRSCRHWGRRASCRPAELESDRKFIQSDPAGAADPGFDDSGWTSVSLPHTFNDVDTFDDWSITGHVGEMNQWAGRTWYRKTFTLPVSFRAKKVFIEFEAVRRARVR